MKSSRLFLNSLPRVSLQGKPIVIAGASSGIGAAAALACARAGMPVLLAARRTDRIELLANQIRAAGGQAHATTADVTSSADCERIVEECVERLGSPYAVYANAGYTLKAGVLDTTSQQFRDIFETNLFGTWNIIKAALPGMVDRKSGHILICSSSIGKFALPAHAAYCASKAAQWPIAHAINAEYAHLNIRATSVHPIGTKTELFKDGSKNLPDSSMQTPEHVAKCIIKALQKPKVEVWPSTTSRILIAAATLMPSTFARVQLRLARKHREQAIQQSNS